MWSSSLHHTLANGRLACAQLPPLKDWWQDIALLVIRHFVCIVIYCNVVPNDDESKYCHWLSFTDTMKSSFNGMMQIYCCVDEMIYVSCKKKIILKYTSPFTLLRCGFLCGAYGMATSLSGVDRIRKLEEKMIQEGRQSVPCQTYHQHNIQISRKYICRV